MQKQEKSKALTLNMNILRENKICVIGPGYVGLPLALAFAEKFQVIRFDNSHYRF